MADGDGGDGEWWTAEDMTAQLSAGTRPTPAMADDVKRDALDIEAKAAEIEKLRAALESIAAEASMVCCATCTAAEALGADDG